MSELVNEIEDILNPRETFEEWNAKQGNQAAQQKPISNVTAKIPYNPDAGLPKFNESACEDLIKILKDDFLESQHVQLSGLIDKGTPPITQLILKGYGNKLADAFKQFYEANLIVGYNKGELEKWVLKYFFY